MGDRVGDFKRENLKIQSTGKVRDYFLEIARGNIEGMSHINKFGRNSSIDTDSTEEIWDGSASFVFPTTALMTSISQTTDQVAMRGGSVKVFGLDSSWDYTEQTVILNASNTTTPVILSTPLIRCFSMEILSNVIIDSPVRIHNVGETQDYAIMDVGNNRTLMAIYTIPNGKTGYMPNYYANMNPAVNKDPTSMQISLWARHNDENNQVHIHHTMGLSLTGNSYWDHPFRPYLKWTQKTDVYLTGTTVGKAADVSAGFDLILVDN